MAAKNGHSGLFKSSDLALLIGEPLSLNFRKYLYKAEKTGVLERVSRGVYMNPNSPPETSDVLIKLAKLLHWNKFIYISLESQLSYLGVISQISIDRLTVMTTGKSRVVKSKFGTIEFTHTKHSVESLDDDIYFDDDFKVFRAHKEKAIRDLKRVGRNIQMLEGEES